MIINYDRVCVNYIKVKLNKMDEGSEIDSSITTYLPRLSKKVRQRTTN